MIVRNNVIVTSSGFTAICLTLTLTFVPRGQGFHDGAPVYSCEFMKPGVKQGGVTGDEGHVTDSQNIVPTYGNSKTPPYYIQVEARALNYTPGESYQLSVVANQTKGANQFKGVLLMARQVSCISPDGIRVTSNAVGSFVIPSTSVLKKIDCFGISGSAVTHSTPQYKINETITWLAPAESSGILVFKATIVQDRTTYWLDVFSPFLRDSNDDPPQCSARTHKAELITSFGLTAVAAIFLCLEHNGI